MPINPHVCKPESIRNLAELEDILKRMDIYRREYVPNASEVGVLKIQTRQFGPIYRIESKENAEKEISKPVVDDGKGNRTCEWGIKYISPFFYKNLKDRFNGGKQKDYQNSNSL